MQKDRIPRIPDLIFVSVLLLALALGQQMLSLDSDLGRHITLGSYMLDARIIPTHDLLSHTRTGLSRPPYEWLSQIIFAVAFRLLGLDGAILLTSLTLALVFTLLYRFLISSSDSALLSLLFVFLAKGASSIHWLPRPHIFTFLFLIIWIKQLERLVGNEPTKTYIFPIIMLFWANMHGGFIFGILAWMAYFAGWAWERLNKKADNLNGTKLLFAGATALFASIITPDLWRNWEAVLNNRSLYILNRTVETTRPNLSDPSVLPYTILLVLTTSLLVMNRKTVKPSQIFLLVGLGVMSLLMARNIPLFAIASVPILSRLGAASLSKLKVWKQVDARFSGFNSASKFSFWSIIFSVLVIALVSIFNTKYTSSLYKFDRAAFPVDAVHYLKENQPTGNMFNEFNWGGYLLYELWPEHDVFLDSQSDFYGEELIRDYDDILNANDKWEHLLKKYQVDWLIIPSTSPLAGEVSNDMDWEIVYSDNVALVGIRNEK